MSCQFHPEVEGGPQIDCSGVPDYEFDPYFIDNKGVHHPHQNGAPAFGPLDKAGESVIPTTMRRLGEAPANGGLRVVGLITRELPGDSLSDMEESA